MRLSRSIIAAAALLMIPMVVSANASDFTAPPSFSNIYLKVGGAAVLFDEGLNKLNIGGGAVGGQNVSIPANYAGEFTLGYHFTPTISVSATVGSPPWATVYGKGSVIGPAGELGQVLYGPAVFTANYHIQGLGAFKPYVGAGFNWTIPLDEKDGAITNLEVDHAFGPAVRAGFDYDLGSNWGIFVDVIKVWVDADIHGNVGPGGPPASAEIQLDPWIIGAGLVHRF